MREGGPADHGPHEAEVERGGGHRLQDGRHRLEGRLQQQGDGGQGDQPGGGHEETPDQAELHSPGELTLCEPATVSRAAATHLVSTMSSKIRNVSEM